MAVLDGYVLGWWNGTNWQRPDNTGTTPPPVRGATFRTASSDATTGISPDPEAYCFPEEDRAYWWTDLGPGVLISGSHPLRAENIRESNAAAAHVDAVRAELNAQGVAADIPVEIDRVFRLDIEGDGVDEVIIEANRVGERGDMPIFLDPGHYSILILRRLQSDDSVANITLSVDVTSAENSKDYLTVVTVRGAADVNGDGTLELFTDYRGYEWGGRTMWTVDGDDVAVALSEGCGV